MAVARRRGLNHVLVPIQSGRRRAMSLQHLVPRDPRFKREQFLVTVTGDQLGPGPYEAVDISSSGVLVYLNDPISQRGDTIRISLQAGSKRWSASARVARCDPDEHGTGHYVGLRFLINAHDIVVTVAGLENGAEQPSPPATAAPNAEMRTRAASSRTIGVASSSSPPAVPVERPAVLLPEDKAKRLQVSEAYVKLVTAAISLIVVIGPLFLRLLSELLGTQVAQLTAVSMWVPLLFVELIIFPSLTIRLVRDVRSHSISIPRAIGLFIMSGAALIAVNLAVQFSVRLARP
jgi:PilZ domain